MQACVRLQGIPGSNGGVCVVHEGSKLVMQTLEALVQQQQRLGARGKNVQTGVLDYACCQHVSD
jgi:hypothetical protein